MLKNVLSSVAVVSCLPAVIAAQEPIALDIHIYANGGFVGSPTIRVAERETGSIRIPNVLDVAVTPTRQGDGRIRVALEFAAVAGTAKPVLAIDEEHPGFVRTPSLAGNEVEIELRVGGPRVAAAASPVYHPGDSQSRPINALSADGR